MGAEWAPQSSDIASHTRPVTLIVFLEAPEDLLVEVVNVWTDRWGPIDRLDLDIVGQFSGPVPHTKLCKPMNLTRSYSRRQFRGKP